MINTEIVRESVRERNDIILTFYPYFTKTEIIITIYNQSNCSVIQTTFTTEEIASYNMSHMTDSFTHLVVNGICHRSFFIAKKIRENTF